MKKAKIIGVIGETGSGKSTFAHYVQSQYNCLVINADKIGHGVLEEEDIKQKLLQKFTDDILENNQINRQRLGNIVFNDKEALEFLSQLTHPRIREHIIKIIQNKARDYAIILIDGVALIEANIGQLCDCVIYIYTSSDIRLKRLMDYRHIEYERALSMISSQKKPDFYKQHADYTMSLNQGIEEKEEEINHLLQEIL